MRLRLKVILVTSFPFFQTLLKRNKYPHPLIYEKGVKSDEKSEAIKLSSQEKLWPNMTSFIREAVKNVSADFFR